MSLWRHVSHGLRALWSRSDSERDLSDELHHYLREAEAELIRAGVTPEQARRRVRLRYGDPLALREDVRAHGWEHVVDTLLGDLRFAARRLRRSPGFAAVAVLTLGLGVGASTAIFSTVKPVLFEPLAYPNPERLLAIHDRSQQGARVPVTFGTYLEVAERSRSFETIAVFATWQPAISGDGEPERLTGQRVSADYFRVLGVDPALGPGFSAEDDRPDGPAVVILSDGLWRRRFGADVGIVGSQVRLNDTPYTVAGVMPAGFENVPGHAAELWSLLQYDASLPSFDGREWGHHLEMAGRLRAGVDARAARAELQAIAANPLPQLARPAWAALGEGFLVASLRDAATANARPALLALFGAVLLLLVIACVNVTNLLLARGARRQGEMAMRAALGAARARLVGQLLSESLVLAFVGGVLAVGVAWVGVRVLVALSPPGLPRVDAITLDGAALAFALAVTTLVGVAVGLAPSLRVLGGDVAPGVGRLSRRATGGHLSARRALVIGEVAVACVLLVGAGLLLRSFRQVSAIPPGFEAEQLLALEVQTVGPDMDDEGTQRFFAQALDAARQVPGVVSVALTSQLPLSGDVDVYGVRRESEQNPEGEDGAAFRYAVSPGYFATMGIPIAQGRAHSRDDGQGAPPVVVINESFAARVYPDGDALGRRLHVGRNDLPWYTVVGVVGDVRQGALSDPPGDAVYIPTDQWYFADRNRWLVVRAAGDAAALVPALKSAVWSVDPDQPIVRIELVGELVTRSQPQRRFVLVILESFAAIALLLAGIGLYGVLSASVGERMRELGVRAALGASTRSLVALVARQGAAITAAGLTLGIAGSALASRALATLLFGVTGLDPFTYAGVVAVLGAVACLACGVPAYRAMRVDPAVTLRGE